MDVLNVKADAQILIFGSNINFKNQSNFLINVSGWKVLMHFKNPFFYFFNATIQKVHKEIYKSINVNFAQ